MEDKPSPLSDLSFLRFPELTPQELANIGWLFLLLVPTVVITVIVHRRITQQALLKEHRTSFERISHEDRQPGLRAR